MSERLHNITPDQIEQRGFLRKTLAYWLIGENLGAGGRLSFTRKGSLILRSGKSRPRTIHYGDQFAVASGKEFRHYRVVST